MREVSPKRRVVPAIVAAAAIVALVVAAIMVVEQALPAAPAPRGEDSSASLGVDLKCPENEPIAQELLGGSTWTMCWRVDASRGLVLEDVHFTPAGDTPVQVLAELSIGQLEVPYDTGLRNTEDITTQGFGGSHMMTLTETECLGERLEANVPKIGDGSMGGGAERRSVLCQEVVDGGIAYRSSDTAGTEVARRTDLRLATISKVGWYEYVSQYTFGGDGSIRSDLGATGDLSPEDYGDDPAHGWPVGPGETDYATSHSHNAVWRVHWALGGQGGQVVEQYDAAPTGELGPRSPLVEGGLTRISREGTAEAADRRWWRVVNPDVLNEDGHEISYQVDAGATTPFELTQDHRHGGEAGGGYAIAFTEADDCQLFATANKEGTCGSGVLDFAEDEAELSDVVTWVAVGFHHVARDEDQSPMEMHWQGFTLTPRDLTAQRADPPSAREGVNGKPTEAP
ncbi:primary-amine oxidase [Promicromonospora sp. AC04]|uniref:copper amine oxidase n=1 Tax=Promicromonospora sp. AC04 TaxID=2135723 RepID=UPI000D37020E|nr:copper amine oxidase [Promicromonospora sp. AC04]PUB30024.1 primary-amine oxidase [Promicromonospora sp. AC04]